MGWPVSAVVVFVICGGRSEVAFGPGAVWNLVCGGGGGIDVGVSKNLASLLFAAFVVVMVVVFLWFVFERKCWRRCCLFGWSPQCTHATDGGDMGF